MPKNPSMNAIIEKKNDKNYKCLLCVKCANDKANKVVSCLCGMRNEHCASSTHASKVLYSRAVRTKNAYGNTMLVCVCGRS